VHKIDIDFISPSVLVQGLTIAKSDGSKPEQLLDINSAVIGSQWRSILTGALAGYIKLDSCRLLLDADMFRRKPGESADKPSPDRNSTSDNRQPWQERVRQLPAFRLTSVVLTDSELRLRGIAGQNGTDIKIDRLNLSVDNVTNSTKLSPTLMARALCTARVMKTGNLEL